MLTREELFAKLSQVKLVASDFDGVLTTGDIFLDKDGNEPLARFHVHDGFAVVMARQCGVKTAIISARKSLCTEIRYNLLKADAVYTGVLNKRRQLEEIAKELSIEMSDVVFIGDDWVDLQVMQHVGISVAPPNAVHEVLNTCDYITNTQAGHGVLREVIELVLKAKGLYADFLQRYTQSPESM